MGSGKIIRRIMNCKSGEKNGKDRANSVMDKDEKWKWEERATMKNGEYVASIMHKKGEP